MLRHRRTEGEFDIAATREQVRGKSIIFCLPGRGVSYTFLKNFVQLCFDLVQSWCKHSNFTGLFFHGQLCTMQSIGMNVLRGPKQVPWDGKLKYDYQLWIDSDIVFNTEAFYKLLVLDKDIAAWLVYDRRWSYHICCTLAEEDDFKNNGGVMNHETGETMQKRRKPFTVDYTGFGWVLIKKGVFENLEYPWFAPKMQVFDSGEVQDMCGEDVSFCLDAKETGFEIWCDPRIRVGHEKSRII